jgi:hypothetical protein
MSRIENFMESRPEMYKSDKRLTRSTKWLAAKDKFDCSYILNVCKSFRKFLAVRRSYSVKKAATAYSEVNRNRLNHSNIQTKTALAHIESRHDGFTNPAMSTRATLLPHTAISLSNLARKLGARISR